MSRRRIVWLGLWVVVLVAIVLTARYADSLFMARMSGGTPQANQIFKLLPEETEVLVYDQNFEEHWKRFKKSNLFFSLRNLSVVRGGIDQSGLSDAELDSLEKWIFRFWGPTAVVSYSQKTNSLYLLSPVGNYAECLEWFQRLATSSFRKNLPWTPRKVQDQWVLEYAKNSGGRSFVAQLATIRGIAVLAISEKKDPMNVIINASLYGASFGPNLEKFLEKTRGKPDQVCGFVRMLEGDRLKESLGLEWILDVQSAEKIKLEIKAPVQSIQQQMKAEKNSLLAALRQPDDQISLFGSWEDLKMFWAECEERLPKKWTEPVNAIKPEGVLGSYQKIWNPIWDKLGDDLFLSLGEVQMFSDRYQIPFPHVTIAMPFTEKALFIKAVESTVQKANAEQDANLLIRKVVVGDLGYYDVRMGNSSWKQSHGLKQFPVFAFAKDLLIVSSNTGSMEKILQKLAQGSELTPEIVYGIDLRMRLHQAPQTIQILLGAVGAFNSEGDNIFLSPTVMHFMSEITSVMKQLGDSHLVMTYEPGSIVLSGELLLN
jgi:hypothetical protein